MMILQLLLALLAITPPAANAQDAPPTRVAVYGLRHDHVWWLLPDLARTPYEDRSSTTDAAGRVRMLLMGVKGERWTLKAETADGRSGRVDVVAEGRAGVEIRVRARAPEDAATVEAK